MPLSRAVLRLILVVAAPLAAQEQAGSIRGTVLDRDFDAPLPSAQVTIVETGEKATTSDQGHYAFGQVPPGRYTVLFSKEGYVRQVAADVVVVAGQLTDLDVALAGEVTEMEEFVVQETLVLAPGSEASLLQLRFDSPSLLDSISADLMSRAGASDAAAALRLVSGASLQDGKSAVIRGLPDRYVSSQMNGVRLPTADEDKRAVELDQFPAAIIESIRVSKTFTPDQQGDASGGAVDVRLKGIPSEPLFFQLKVQTSVNSQAVGEDRFLSYEGGGLSYFGSDDGGRDIQFENLGSNWEGAVGVIDDSAPIDYKWSVAGGGKHEFDGGLKIGGFGAFFYERDSSFYDNGVDDTYWVENPGEPLTPQTSQGSVLSGDFRTSLFDVTRASKLVQWGGLATVGVEYAEQSLALTYLYTRTAEDTATLAEDTRGKEFFFPGHDPYDPTTPGHDQPDAAPYLRLETLDYTERTTDTFQLHGRHKLPLPAWGIANLIEFRAPPEIDWLAAFSSATQDQPDRRQFGSAWFPEREVLPGFVLPAMYRGFFPAANFNLGNLQRIWEEIEEESEQYAVNLKLPFEQWSGDEGWLKLGWFTDHVDRVFDQETFSNFGDSGASFEGDFDDFWSESFPFETDPGHPITASTYDVDYEAELDVTAWYGMLNLPLTPWLRLVGGVRLESTEIGIVNAPEEDATWFPPGSTSATQLNPGDADVLFEQDDVLPSIGLEINPLEGVTLRTAYNETVARQTFKELTPIIQQEYAGGPVFIGNPELRMAAVRNYDVRVDYVPYPGGLLSGSWFRKELEDPIEYVQRISPTAFTYTTAVNYPEGELSGFELEMRQDLGHFWSALEGLSIGANATFIDSEVKLPDDEAAGFELPGVLAPMRTRDMTDAPEHLYNLYLTYDLAETGTQLALFYTVQGDTLIAGAGQSDGNFVPNVYAKEFGTLNLSLAQRLGKHFKLQLEAKNLTNPRIEEVYRSEHIDGDVRKTSYTAGVEFSISLSAEFHF